MVPAAPPSNPARTERLRSLGFNDPGELEDVVEAVAAFCGAPAQMVLRDEAEDLPGGDGHRILDPRGQVWGLLRVEAADAGPARAGVAQTVHLIERMVARAEARLERRGASRGPAGSAFVPGLVHELRNAAFGFSAILDAFQARYQDREEAQRYGGALRRNLEQLTGFIEELGAYGDPRSGSRERQPLDPLLRDAAALCQPIAERLGVTLQVAWEGPPVQVEADAASLREAFTSLLRWALGQGLGIDTGRGRTVTLAAGPQGGGAAGSLQGPGLAGCVVGSGQAQDLARVFEPFYFRAAGMGRLALPVARRILEAHGGSLTAAAAEGGMTISFTLPGA